MQRGRPGSSQMMTDAFLHLAHQRETVPIPRLVAVAEGQCQRGQGGVLSAWPRFDTWPRARLMPSGFREIKEFSSLTSPRNSRG